MSWQALGVDIGGTKIAAGIVTEQGEVLSRVSAPTPATAGGPAVVDVALALARELLREHDADAVGIGAAGVISPETQDVISATGSIADWAGTVLGRTVSESLDLSAIVVNDVHAHALGEAIFGAGRGEQSMIMAVVGTGVGGAYVQDGKVQMGTVGAAGHIGHIPVADAAGLPCPCGRSGHVEGLCSGAALVPLFHSLGGDISVTSAREVIARADSDPAATEATTRAARGLGQALGGVVNMLDPSSIIISGGLGISPGLWWSTLVHQVRKTTIPLLELIPVRRATLGNDAAIIGAAHATRLDERS